MIEAVIFDLDGTLINLPINYDELFKELSKITKTQDLRPLAEKISELDTATKKKVFQAWDKIERDAQKQVTMLEEGKVLYGKYSPKPRVLVTMQGKAFVRKLLASMELQFDLVYTRENSLNRIEQLGLAAQDLHKPFEKILFIGNTEDDRLAAKTVGCQYHEVKP